MHYRRFLQFAYACFSITVVACEAPTPSSPPAKELPWSARDLGGPGPTKQVPFYIPPNPLPKGLPGEVIRSEEVTDMKLTDQVRAIRMLYHSENSAGRDIAVSGVVFVPRASPPAGGFPVLAWAHGTTGVGDACAPSKWADLYEYLDYVQTLSAAGYVVAATDYEGLGTPGAHPYLDKDVEARGVIDSVRAARALVPETSSQWLAIGHSQGGQAALAAGEVAVSRAPELTYLGTVAQAPASALTLLPALRNTDVRGYVVFLAAGIVATNETIHYADLLGPVASGKTSVLETGCWWEVMDTYRPLDPEELRPTTEVGFEALNEYLVRNEPGTKPLGTPVFLVQGEADDSVPAFITSNLADRLCQGGDVVHLQVYPNLGHDEVLLPSLPDTLAWIHARVDGEMAPTDCAGP